MGHKVNFNKRNSPELNSKSFKRIGAIFIIIVLLIILITNIAKRYKKEYGNENSNLNNTNYNISTSSIDDVLREYNAKLLDYNDSIDKLTMYVEFDRNLFDGDKSNQKFFLDLCDVMAEFLDYKDFEFIDNKKDINISVICDKPSITQIIINGDNNYFLNKQTEINLKNYQNPVTNFTIQSKELQELIINNWKENDISFGTRESIVDGYNIFFDEGIVYRSIASRIFNIIFTSNYTSQIIGGLRVGATPTQVIASLGDPTFSFNERIYGYKNDNSYVFFDFENDQISCYPIRTLLEQNENDLSAYINEMNETGNIKDFATKVTTMWIDYDKYEFDSDYVDLKYTLRGINLNISNNSLENGLFIYQNYQGDKNITDLENVYLKDIDSVFEYETNRSLSESMNRVDPGDFSEEYYEKYLGTKYSVKFYRFDGNTHVGPKFYCRDKSFPDSELNKHTDISSYIWLNENIFIYSIDNDGIYAYNCDDRNNQKILDLNEKIKINSIENGSLVYNDSNTLQIIVENQ